MSDMLAYSVAMLSNIGEFLSSEPMIYVFSFLCLVFVVKVFSILLPCNK